MTRAPASLAALLLLAQPLTGCTVSAVSAADDPRPNNSCESSADCRGGSCRTGVCQAAAGEIEGLLVEVTPPSDSGLPHLGMVAHLEDVPSGGGDLSFTLARPGHVTGGLSLPAAATCYPELPQDGPMPLPKAPDSSLPVSVTFMPRERLLGLSQQLYLAGTGGLRADGGYRFELHVPAGDYDVYVAPPRGQQGCAVPPQLFRNQRIEGEVTLAYSVSAGSSLALKLRWPKASPPLSGWIADVIEPLGGHSISTEVTLGAAADESATNAAYDVALVYSTVTQLAGAAPQAANDLVRLRPPEGLVAPTIFLDRSALGLFQADKTAPVEITRFTRFPSAVRVEGQVVRRDDGRPTRGYVSLVSTEIFGVDPGIFASFQTTLQIADDGVLALDMPPGKYRVYAVPPMAEGLGPVEGALSALEARWEVPADVAFQAGKLLELPSISAIAGQSSFQGAEVRVQASPQSVLPFEEVFGAAAFTPRASSGLVDPGGRFVVQVDPGRFDVSLRAPESLGFGWYVHPGVDVGGTAQDLGRVQLPRPSVVTGTASIAAAGGATTSIASALIRAYAYLDKDLAYTSDVTRAVSVIQVAETRADEMGAFRLLLPSSIAAPK